MYAVRQDHANECLFADFMHQELPCERHFAGPIYSNLAHTAAVTGSLKLVFGRTL